MHTISADELSPGMEVITHNGLAFLVENVQEHPNGRLIVFTLTNGQDYAVLKDSPLTVAGE